MSDELVKIEKQIISFSLAEQIHLLTFIANNVNKHTSLLAEENISQKMRESSLATVWESVKNDAW